jgi:hypothetical protein
MTQTVIHSHKDLIVWQRAMELVDAIYALTEQFPDTERFNLSNQLQRAAVSIPQILPRDEDEIQERISRTFLQWLTVQARNSRPRSKSQSIRHLVKNCHLKK